MKLTPYQEKLFNHVGEVVAVYDSSHKQLWSHPNHREFFKKGENNPGLRVWVSFGEDKGPYQGEYTFILTSDGPAPEGVYNYEGVSDEEAVRDVISMILVSICEDVTTWGQAAFEEPFLSIVDKIAGAAYRGEGKVFLHFSPDCAIWVDGKTVGYDT